MPVRRVGGQGGVGRRSAPCPRRRGQHGPTGRHGSLERVRVECKSAPAAGSRSRGDLAGRIMKLDTKKIDDATLALLYLGLHDGARAWKGFDWDAMNRLHEQGCLTDPRGKAKS